MLRDFRWKPLNIKAARHDGEKTEIIQNGKNTHVEFSDEKGRCGSVRTRGREEERMRWRQRREREAEEERKYRAGVAEASWGSLSRSRRSGMADEACLASLVRQDRRRREKASDALSWRHVTVVGMGEGEAQGWLLVEDSRVRGKVVSPGLSRAGRLAARARVERKPDPGAVTDEREGGREGRALETVAPETKRETGRREGGKQEGAAGRE